MSLIPWIFAAGMAVASGLFLWLATRRMKAPLADLAGTIGQIAARKDYSLRAPEGSSLARAFNEMLAQLQARDVSLQIARDDLERRLDERTLELQRKEELLLQSQKMEAVGRLAGGLAHDFNNLLSAVLGFGELALAQPALDARTREFLEEVQKAGQQAATLTSQLLAISRHQMLQPVLLDLNAVLKDLEGTLARLAGDHVALEFRAHPALPRIKADPAPMRQVVLHLVANAREAMPGGGLLRVETREVSLESPLTWRNETVPPGTYARLSVSDSGEGISAEVQAHLFEPFFNARGRTLDRATGLGLSTVYGIVKQSGGFITVESERGKGATFSAYFPAQGDGAPWRTTTVRVARPPKDGCTVLLVEDEAMIRRLAGEVLRRGGLAVQEATNGREALEMFAEHPDRFDLVLSDVVMPHMGGRELVERISTLRPSTKILFMSGYTDDAELLDEIRKRRIPLLTKPFSAADLTAKVKEMLGHSAKEKKP